MNGARSVSKSSSGKTRVGLSRCQHAPLAQTFKTPSYFQPAMAQKSPNLSVVISGYNEEQAVEHVLLGVLHFFDENKIDGELIFMDNHSTDKTGEISEKVAKTDKRLTIIHRRNRPNQDLGSSLREGLQNTTGSYLLIMDCDASHDYNEINNLWGHKEEADIIIGSRYVAGGRAELNPKRWLFSTGYNLFARLLTGVNVKDMTTGFKLYKKEVFENMNLTNNGFGLHVEILLKAASKGSTFKEVPITYKKSGKSHLNYKKQFPSYMKPVLDMFKARLKREPYQ